MRHLFAALLSILALPQSPRFGVPFRTPEGAYAVLHFKTLDAGATSHAAAVDVLIDGRRDQIVLLTPGVKRNDYGSVIGPLNAGSHGAQLVFSSLWPLDQTLRIDDVSIDVVAPGDARFEIFANAPAIGVRADTIGSASDLPLLMYVEHSTEGDSRWLRYSVIFSHEDGGTPGAALMSRWGRTTDIELAYEVELRDRRIAQARYQGPDHRVIANERLDVHPPFLLVSTLNNMFLDRGRSAATVRMVPIQVDLSTRSRESVMDDHPWIYRVMARELATERPAEVGDPRDYVYVDLRLTSRAAGVALGLRGEDGTTRWSDRGRADLVVSRQGEMRIAIPAPAQDKPSSLSIRCDPRPEPNRSADAAQCDAEVRKAFRLDADHQPGPSLVSPALLTIAAGTARDLAFDANRIE